MKRATILAALVLSATAGFVTPADAKPIAITYQLAVTDQVESVSTFSALRRDAEGAPPVLRQIAYPVSAIRLAGPARFDTDAAGSIAALSGTLFVGVSSPAGTLYCRAFAQTGKDKRGEHAGVCLRDSDNDGAFDRQFESVGGKAMTAFDIRRVEQPRPIGAVRYTLLAREQTPRTDLVVISDVNYAPAIGAEPRPLSMSFLTLLSMPGELLTENWKDRHWPLIQFDLKGSDRLPPRSAPVQFTGLKASRLGPFAFDVSGEPGALALKAEGSATPGVYDLRGDFDAKMGVSETRRVFKLVPAKDAAP